MLMEIVLIIVAFVVGALLAYLFTQNKLKSVQSDLLLAQQQTQTERQAKDELQGRLQAAADEAGQLRSQLSDVKAQLSAVQAQLDTERAHNASETKLRQELNKLMPPEIPKRVEAFVRENPQSEVSVYLVQRYFLQENPDYKKANELVKLMIAAQPNNGQLIKWRKELPDLSSGQMNSRLGNFSAKDVKGRIVTQEDLKHKVNVVTAWATWNYQSTDMQRRLLKLKKDYGDKLGVVSICLDGRPADVKQRVERDSVPWKTVCDGRLWQSSLLGHFGIADVPSCLVADNRGTIVARDLTPDKLEDRIKQMLK